MKVLGIVGSPRKAGNTERLIAEALAVAQADGIDTEMVTLAGLLIQGCDACMGCRNAKRCVVEDDFQSVYERMLEADAIIIGSPVHFSAPTPSVLALMHRAGYVAQAVGRPFERKIGGPITVARRAGQNFALAQMLFFFLHQGMVVPGSTYWNIAFGRAAGDVTADEEGMQTVRNFAKNVVWLLQKTRE